MINSNCTGAIVASQAEMVNRNPTGRATELGMVPQIRPQWEISNQKAQVSLSSALCVLFNSKFSCSCASHNLQLCEPYRRSRQMEPGLGKTQTPDHQDDEHRP
jgi:hypothetical protein